MKNFIFKRFKNKHKGETAVLFGSGPTANEYKPIEGIDINVGCNFIGDLPLFNQRQPSYEMLDYYFFGDRGRSMNKFFKVKEQKFGASEVNGQPHPLHYSDEEVVSLGALPMSVNNNNPTFSLDISENPTHGQSVIFHALNFLFWVGVSKIYIVGCDCSQRQCFDGREIINSGNGTYDAYKAGWINAKNFIEKNNLDTKIISVNPIGLKGMFEEI